MSYSNKLPEGNEYNEYDEYQVESDADYIINWNLNNVRYLKKALDGITDLADVSGYYSKDEIDQLFTNYYDKSYIDETLALYYTKDQVDTILVENYATFNDLNNYYTKAQIDNNYLLISTFDTAMQSVNDAINENTANIAENSNDIVTLTNLVNSTFETNGEYTSSAGTLTAGTVVRPVLSVEIALDSSLVEVSVAPQQNLFINKADGRIDFTISFVALTNDEVLKQISLNIFKNNELFKTITKTIEASQVISPTIFGVMDVKNGDAIYFTYSITSGTGSVTTANEIVYNINFKSKGDVTAIKTSTLILDYEQLPNNGANPEFVLNHQNTDNINLNKTAIENNATNISTNETNINAQTEQIDKINERKELINNPNNNLINNNTEVILTESYKHFETLEFRLGNSNFRMAPVMNTRLMNVGDTIEIWSSYLVSISYVINSETSFTISSSNNSQGIFKMWGAHRIN